MSIRLVKFIRCALESVNLYLAGNIFICHKLTESSTANQEDSDGEDDGFSSNVVYKIGGFNLTCGLLKLKVG